LILHAADSCWVLKPLNKYIMKIFYVDKDNVMYCVIQIYCHILKMNCRMKINVYKQMLTLFQVLRTIKCTSWSIGCLTARQHRKVQFVPIAGDENWQCNTVPSKTLRYLKATTGYLVKWCTCLLLHSQIPHTHYSIQFRPGHM